MVSSSLLAGLLVVVAVPRASSFSSNKRSTGVSATELCAVLVPFANEGCKEAKADEQKCMAEMTQLDISGDGMISPEEAKAKLDDIPKKLAKALAHVDVEAGCVWGKVLSTWEASQVLSFRWLSGEVNPSRRKLAKLIKNSAISSVDVSEPDKIMKSIVPVPSPSLDEPRPSPPDLVGHTFPCTACAGGHGWYPRHIQTHIGCYHHCPPSGAA